MSSRPPPQGPWEWILGWFVDNPLPVALFALLVVGAGFYTAPFDWDAFDLPRDRVPVDAIPDVGENQQIVFTEWPGRSPRDVEDQVTYPLTTALLGIPGVRTVRSSSMLGFSTVYVIFEDGVEFYWSRSRVLEKLAALPEGTLPDGVAPALGPDATALGQVFWYTLEGRDTEGRAVGGWDLHELRSIQDFQIRYALQSVPGVSEVASVGGYVREYQVDVDPESMRAHHVTLGQIAGAVRGSNLDVGARTVEINRAEYVVRGLGFVRSPADLEETVVASRDGTPVRVRDVARVALGPAQRRGALDDEGAEAVGGVVVVRFGANPMEVIQRVNERIAEIGPGLPTRTLADGTEAQVTVVPFYDRTALIEETLGTLSTALWQQLLVTVLVVLIMLRRLRTSLLVSVLLPLGVLGAFVAMKVFGVDANIMALAGIAIAIGTMVDMGIVFTENIARHLDASTGEEPRAVVVRRAAAEVAPAVLTSALTTVVSFLPVFALGASEGKLFRPLAWTKSFALLGALLVAAIVIPAGARLILSKRRPANAPSARRNELVRRGLLVVSIGVVGALLTSSWAPLGPHRGFIPNAVFVVALLAFVLGGLTLFLRAYPAILALCLRRKPVFLAVPAVVVVLGALAFVRLGEEYMPAFDEGSFLFMPSTMPHASIGEALDMLSTMDAAISAIPEVDRVVGKAGRAESPLDPAPVSMFETVVTYIPEFRTEADGTRVRQWRDHVRSPDDIWNEIVHAADLPGLTSAPVLMPISTRIVMLQSGMRAPMGVKVRGPDLASIERFGFALEEVLREVDGVRPETVFADRVVGKPYLEIDVDREAIGRYGLTMARVQQTIQLAVGGQVVTRTVEGRERYPVRVRYLREERDSVEAIRRVLVDTPGGQQIPLEQLAEVRYVRGPQVIKSEDGFLTSYVLFDRRSDVAEVEAVERARALIEARIDAGELEVPTGVSWAFAGSFENQVRSKRQLTVLVPVAIALIFLLLHLQFRRVSTTLIIFSAVGVAAAGGFALLWLWGQPGFLDATVLGRHMGDLFSTGTVNLSVAVWVGFIALLGIATDDGVVMATYLKQRFAASPPTDVAGVRARVLEAGMLRIRPCLMTTATTLLALLPVITSQGRGADVMVPMALPAVGGMTVALITLFVVPVLYGAVEERRVRSAARG